MSTVSDETDIEGTIEEVHYHADGTAALLLRSADGALHTVLLSSGQLKELLEESEAQPS